MSHTKLLFLLLIPALLSACSHSTQPDPRRDDIRGQVLDAGGQPVAGATLVLQHAIDPPLVRPVDKIGTMVRFDLPEPGPVSMWVGSYCDTDTVRVLVDGELPAGEFSVVWDGRDAAGRSVPDGVYWVHLVTPDATSRYDILLLRLGYGDLEPEDVPPPLAVTDAGGSFTLDQACLPFGHTFVGTNEAGEPTETVTLTREVRVWAFQPAVGVATGSTWVTVDADRGAVVTVTLIGKPRD